MLVVHAHVEADPVEHAVIGIGLLPFAGDVVLLHPASAERVQAKGEHRREEQVGQRLGAERPQDRRVDGQHRHRVGDEPAIGQGHALDLVGPERLGKGQEEHPDRLAERRAADQGGFGPADDVGIQLGVPQVLVVQQVVFAEGLGAGKGQAEVAERGQAAVDHGVPGHEVMGALVDQHEQGMAGEGAHQIGDHQHEGPVQVPHEPGDRPLHRNEANDPGEGHEVVADQRLDFRVLGKDLPTPAVVRRRRIGIEKVLILTRCHARPALSPATRLPIQRGHSMALQKAARPEAPLR